MEINLEIDEPFAGEILPQRLIAAVELTLQRHGREIAPGSAGTLNLVITDAESIRQLNEQYLGLDAPTDVLSFENPADPEFPTGETDHLGDIIIAYPVAQAQARAAGHTAMEEVVLLAVHGTLHLSGFDHDTAESKTAMWAAQGQVMAELGLAHVQPTEE